MIHFAGTLGFGDLASLAIDGSLFAANAVEKLECLQAELLPLSERYDVVVANPPYMGGSNMNKWISAWEKNNYANAKRDLCTCFVDRGFSLANDCGHISMITASSWMFISSFEEFRKSLLRRSSVTSMIQQSTHGYAGVTVPTTMFVLAEGAQGVTGTYIRLEDFDRPQWQEPRALEALANPDCGWFYEARSDDFEAIPGSSIAYWAGSGALAHFKNNETLASHGRFLNGMSTGKNEAVVRCWSEVSLSKTSFDSESHQAFQAKNAKFAPYNKGGEFRKWYGNQWDVLAYDEESNEYMDTLVGHRHNNPDTYFRQCLSWSKISSGKLAMRLFPNGFIYDVAGCSLFLDDPSEELYVLALFNSSVEMRYLEFLAPTLNFEAGQIRKTPFIRDESHVDVVASLASENINLSKADWDSFEESWYFSKHPLI